MRPLDGVTVVSLEQAVAAPFVTRHLADLGAILEAGQHTATILAELGYEPDEIKQIKESGMI